ncbi:P-loop containing nucleoside triphosphate hydrolase protein [Athelia psychrophila]|uniref:ATP-dependent RNA helicase n=1 Tax=Athelia psychrophila TaxID=1759441 RepID=A0A167U7Y9_9AGAM|nr:P-loop containing nucleoside triphosphate hydrolase protein [Fibularhizoctonia sp. CBS 109695]
MLSCSLRAARLSAELSERCLHSSASLNAQPRTKKGGRKPGLTNSPSRTRLVDNLKPKPGSGGRLEVAPKPNRFSSVKGKSKAPGSTSTPPPGPAFTRDSVPHEGRAPIDESSRPTRRPKTDLEDIPPIPTTSQAHNLKSWASRAHEERVEKRQAARKLPRKPPVDPLGNEFSDAATKTELSDELPTEFASPPLLPGLLTCLKEVIPPKAKPTPIQALSLKHLFTRKESQDPWRQVLLASETGSGKTTAYLLPMLQDLKQTELSARPAGSQRLMQPRALVLAPTHELSRQLASSAKALLHISKLRVLCASRANAPSNPRASGTAAKMASDMAAFSNAGEAGSEFQVRQSTERARAVDVMVGTPNKVLEMTRGRGWNWDERLEAKLQKEASMGRDVDLDATRKSFYTEAPEMGLANVEWVVVDEADVMFDPDFQEYTRMLLADIALARGVSVPFDPTSDLNPLGSETPNAPINYPFNLILTSATIPSSLASYIDTTHPTMTRLASPHLHHLPKSLKPEYDSLRGKDGQRGHLSKVLIFCNKRSKVADLSEFLEEKGIKHVALAGGAEARKRGSNHHLDGFLRVKTKALAIPTSESGVTPAGALPPLADAKDPRKTPHVLLTTSLLSRGLDFAPDIKHVFIVDEPRNMIDFLHRAGRAGRAGEKGRVVVFGKMEGRGSALAKDVRKKVGALKA